MKPTRDPRLLRASLACFAGFCACAWAFIALNGCASPLRRDVALYSVAGGAVGVSNDPIKFAKPLPLLRTPYSTLRVGYYVVREDRVGFGYRYVLHQIVAGPLPDGSYVMQGANRVTNPAPDATPLTHRNYIGMAFPLSSTN